ESRPGMYSAILAVPLNFVLNYLLMFGAMGFPKMGAVGAGWATCIVWWVLAIGFWTFTYTRKKYQQYALWGPFEWPRWEVMRTMLGIGLPNGMSLALEVSMFALTALLIATLGIVELASHQVALNFASITFMIPLGFSIATTSRVGFMAGKGDLDGVRTAGHVGIALCTAVMVVTALIMILFPGWIVRIYTSDPVVMSLASQLLVLAGIFQVSDGLQVSASSALRGLKDTRIPMYVNLLSYWGVGLPLGYYLGIMRGWGVQGFWIGLIGGLTVAAFFHPFRFQRLTRAMARERADN
ncbi:MAG TPA: MATE family efflux transporter, partial [Calditrichia bacterium]|nr:MATE family efflux transporter [Calditrichia bacterium]